MACAFGVISGKSFVGPISRNSSYTFTSRSFIHLGLRFRSLSHFDNVWGHKESDMTEATTPALELPEILLESNEKSDLKSRLAHILPAFYLLSPMGRISVISESPGHL